MNGNYEIAWNDLKAALHNEEACRRYVRGREKTESCSDMSDLQIAEKLRDKIQNQGAIYATVPVNHVQCR